jgi:hypothetical protein
MLLCTDERKKGATLKDGIISHPKGGHVSPIRIFSEKEEQN